MVSVTVFRPLAHDEDLDVLVKATVQRGKLQLEGPRVDLVDTKQELYSVRLDKFLAFKDDSEEWLRAFAESFAAPR